MCYAAQGILSLHGKQKKAMLQGVHELYELNDTPEGWTDVEPRINRLVFIGEKSTPFLLSEPNITELRKILIT